MSGFCATPATDDPESSHLRCRGGNTANPAKEFQPCPDACHYRDLPHYECGECGGTLVETAWANDDPDDVDDEGNPEPVYVHVDKRDHLLQSVQVCP
jgi:hypothetical protein